MMTNKELKITTLEVLREFITFVKDRYTTKITTGHGGCSTCGYGGNQITVGYETDYNAMFENLESDIDEFSKTFEED